MQVLEVKPIFKKEKKDVMLISAYKPWKINVKQVIFCIFDVSVLFMEWAINFHMQLSRKHISI